MIRSHIVNGLQPIGAAKEPVTVDNVQGGKLEVSGQGGRVTVNGKAISTANVFASNGVIHAVDSVLVLPASDSSSRDK
jgi:uncharacterized surface protein with fasciclin (FAS1) repeats